MTAFDQFCIFFVNILPSICDKFEVPSFNRSLDVRGSNIPKVGNVTPTWPLLTQFCRFLIFLSVFNLSVKFDANGFNDNRYMAILQLRRFGCEMRIRANFGELFLRILSPKIVKLLFCPQSYALPSETRVLRYCALKSVQRSHLWPCLNISIM